MSTRTEARHVYSNSLVYLDANGPVHAMLLVDSLLVVAG